MSYMDGLIIAITIFAFALIIINGMLVVQGVINGISNAGVITPNMATYNLFVSDGQIIYSFDVGILLLYFGLFIVAILSAAFLESQTINLPIGIFMGVVTIFISFIISNIAHGIFTQPAYAGVIGHIPNTILLFANLPIYTAIFIAMYVTVIVARPLITTSGKSPIGF